MKQQSVSDSGDHGLRLTIDAPEAVPAGQRFKIRYEVSDDEGEIRGIAIDWGDGKTWGGVPSDLVCTGVAGEEPQAEPSSSETKSVAHAYREGPQHTVEISAYTGGCEAHYDRVSVELDIEVIGEDSSSNGPLPPRAKVGHAYYTEGDPSVLVSDIGGYDEDGFVHRIEIDWGDGKTDVLERPIEMCDPEAGGYPGGWFSQPTKHRYDKRGDYLVSVRVISMGCDEQDVQTDSVGRVLGYPPRQGS